MTRLGFTPSPADSIDGVVDQLTSIIDASKAANSRAGYFAALYRRVTVAVATGIKNGEFEDGARMERFDVTFANRYLEALRLHQQGGTPSRCWAIAFESTGEYWPIVLQHLLLGMNAHINLDLGIAAAEVMQGQPLEALHADFNRINGVLASLVGEVQTELADVWLLLRVFGPLLGGVDDRIINFSMERARDAAWSSAERLSSLAPPLWPAAIGAQDIATTAIGSIVRSPGVLLGAVTKVVRIGERGGVSRVIEILT